MKTVNDFNFEGKKALIRVDFNVPLNEELEVTDDSRIRAAKPTIIKILEDGGSCVIMSHLGRPSGNEEKYSLKNIEGTIENVIGVEVKFVSDCNGKEALDAVSELKAGELILLENLRFHKEEKAGDREFAEQLSRYGDVYINDAFGAAHRAHASTTIIADFFPSNKYLGLLFASEIENLNKVMTQGETPVTAIIGGAKVSSKITVIETILDKIDHLIIGGGMAFTFIKAQGGSVGSSLVEEDKKSVALLILKKAKEKNVKVYLPVDVLVADDFSNDANTQISAIDSIPEGWIGLDVGPKTKAIFSEVVLQSKTILWNGPVGVFELPTFATGTIHLGNSIAEATKNGAFSLVGGGDSVAAVKKFEIANKMSYVSTGGGAMLEMLEGKTLPGIEALSK